MVFYQLIFFTRDKQDILEGLKILLEFENSSHRVSIMRFERTFIWVPSQGLSPRTLFIGYQTGTTCNGI